MTDSSLFDSEVPILPYAGTSGHSGSITSRQRAVIEDETGITSRRQTMALDALRESGTEGLTYKDLCLRFGWHHGQASGVLSVLHKEHQIARLATSRNRCRIYVASGFVNGRKVEAHKSNQPKVDEPPAPVAPTGMTAVLLPTWMLKALTNPDETMSDTKTQTVWATLIQAAQIALTDQS